MVYRVKTKYSADNDTYLGLAKNRRAKRKEVITVPFNAALDTQVFGVACYVSLDERGVYAAKTGGKRS